MPTTIDSLSLNIKANSVNATQSVNTLIKSLQSLESGLGKINLSGLNSLSSNLNTFSTSVERLSKVKKPDYNRIRTGLETIAKVDSGSLISAGNAIGSLVPAMSQLSNINISTNGITNFVNAITRMSGASSQVASIDFSGLGNGILSMTQTIQGSTVSSDIINFTNAIGRLASAGANTAVTAGSLASLGSALQKLFTDMSSVSAISDGTRQFTASIASLANAGSRTGVTASNLGALGNELKKFFATMSTAKTVNQNIIDMTKALAELANTGTKTANATRALSSVGTSINKFFTSFKNGVARVTKSSFNLASAFGMLYAKYWILMRAIRIVSGWVELASSLHEIQHVVNVTFGDMTSKVDEFAKNSIQSLGMSELSVKTYASRFQSMGRAMGISTAQIADANKRLASMTTGYDSKDLSKPYVAMSSSLTDVSLNLTKLTADMSSFYNVAQSDVASALQSGVYGGQARALRKYGVDLSNATLEEWAHKNGIEAKMKTMTQAEKTMLRYQYVIASLKDTYGDFEKTSDSWANQVRILKQSFQQLGVVVGNLIIGIFKPLLKALNKALQGVITFAQSLANALGAIFGWKMEIQGGAVDDTLDDASDSMDDISDSADSASSSLKDATKSAKEYKNTLMGFDQINKLGEQSSGSKKKDTDSTSDSSDNSVATTATSDAKGLLQAYESNIKSLYGLGKSIRDALIKTLGNIKWDRVYTKARSFGTGLANYLNGLFSTDKKGQNIFKSLGETLAGALNTVVYSVLSFSNQFHWYDFGEGIASGIGRFLQRADFTSLGKSAGTLANGIITTIYAVVSKKENWALLGDKLASGINGFIEGMNKKDLATGKNGWEKFGATANSIIDGIKTAIAHFVKRTSWEKVFKAIRDVLKEIKLSNIALIIGVLTISKFGSVVIGSVFASIGKRILKTILLGFATSSAGAGLGAMGSIISSALLGIKTAVMGLIGTIAGSPFLLVGLAIVGLIVSGFLIWKNWDKIKKWVGNVKDKIVSFWDKWKNVLKPIGEAMLAGICPPISIAYRILSTAYRKIKSWWKDVSANGLSIEVTPLYPTATAYRRRTNADGGIFINGHWEPVQKYAGGGSPDYGQYFIAREKGPELVGTINGHTAVMNNDQIVSSVSAGVYNAVSSALSVLGGNETNVNVTLKGDAGKVFELVKTENNRRVRATRTAQLLV